MALEYREARKEPQESQPEVVMDRHLYLTEEKDRVVEENDPASRVLWCTPGMSVPLAEARRLGAIKPDGEAESVDDDAEPADVEATAKRRTPAQNKQRKPRENKSKDEPEAPPAEEE